MYQTSIEDPDTFWAEQAENSSAGIKLGIFSVFRQFALRPVNSRSSAGRSRTGSTSGSSFSGSTCFSSMQPTVVAKLLHNGEQLLQVQSYRLFPIPVLIYPNLFAVQHEQAHVFAIDAVRHIYLDIDIYS